MRSRTFKDKGVFHIQDMKDTAVPINLIQLQMVLAERFNVVM